jgi:hypothetical protein
MKRWLTASAIPLVLFCLHTTTLNAQEIDATVTVNDDRLPLAARQEVVGFADEMQRYINTTRWTADEWEGEKVKVNINVVFDNVEGNVYTARILFGSQRNVNKSTNLSPMMKVLDEQWEFRYVRNQPFQQEPTRYDEVTGLIDFYIYIALGLDFDSYAYGGGNPMYERAAQIAQRAQIRQDLNGWGTHETPGSYSRYGLIQELTDLRFLPIRRFIFDYHYNGLDLLADNRSAGLDSISTHLTSLVKAKDKLVQSSTLIRVLNDAKNIEYAELFAGSGADNIVWRKLLYIDPGHQSVYEEARER